MIIKAKIDEKKIQKIVIDVFDLIFLFLGGFPKIIEITKDGQKIDTSSLAGKYITDDYFKRHTLSFCNISENNFNQTVLDAYRGIHSVPIASMQCLVSTNYKHIVTNHRIVLLLHVLDGLIQEKDIANYNNEMRNRYALSYSPNTNDYAVKVYFLCRNYIFFYNDKYNCDILSLLNVNEYDFVKIITQTRVWYSHFLADIERPHRLSDGSEICIYFEIVFYAIRLYIASKIGSFER